MLLWSGGKGVSGEMVGGGPDWVKKTMSEGKVSMGVKGWYYVNGIYSNQWGIGHAGWGGQWMWADPKSETVIAIFSGLMGANPAEPEYLMRLLNLTQEVVEYQRKKD